MVEFGKSDAAARGVGAAIGHGEAGGAPASHLTKINMRQSRAGAIVVVCDDYCRGAVAHLHKVDELP